MAKRKKKKLILGYYDVKKLINAFNDVVYYIIFGERRNGKTYSAKKVIIDSVKEGNKFVYMRRKHAHIVEKRSKDYFKDVQDYAIKQLDSEIYYDAKLGFYIMYNGVKELIGYVHCVEDAYENKGGVYNDIEYILFDEFIDYHYMRDEKELFQHAIANCYSQEIENKIKVIMIGNTIATQPSNPYFELFHIEPKEMKQGEIRRFEHQRGVIGVTQYTPTSYHSREEIDSKTKRSRVLGFDDDISNMILQGEWELRKCNTRPIDNISWRNKRHLLPIAVTTFDNVFEITLYIDSALPIVFVRTINTQDGKVNEYIKYNLSYDNLTKLVNKDGAVPIINKVNELVDEDTRKGYKLMMSCLQVGRVVFSSVPEGSLFLGVMEELS